ncbi:MAG TPA: hypothetical protein VF885_14130 [Arthrobacter sp.]
MNSSNPTASRLAIPVDEPTLADTFIEVRGYFRPGCPESRARAGYSGIYRRWHDGRWYPNGAVQGPASRSWDELTCPSANVAEVLITVLAVPLSA